MAAQPLSTRTIARVFFTLVGLAVLLYLVYQARSVLGLIFGAVFLAVALGPAVDHVQRLRLGRGASILVVFLFLFSAVTLVGTLVVPPIVDQVEILVGDVPEYIQEARENETLRRYDDRYQITDRLQAQAATLPARLADAAGALQSVTVGVFSTLVQLLTVLTITFFLLLDGRRIVELVLAQFSPERAERWSRVGRQVYRSTGGYVAGALLLALMCGAATYVVLTIIGLPFSVPLAVLMAFLALIPLVGATIGGLVVGIVTLFAGEFPRDLIVWIVFILAYQQFENNILQPQIYQRTVNLHPLAVIVAILVGSSLLGVLGALVAIPIAAALQIVLRDMLRHRYPGKLVSATDAESGAKVAPPAPAPASSASRAGSV